MEVTPPDRKRTRIAAAICAGLIALFGVLSWDSARQSSPTFDEPLHALAGWTSLRWQDHRLNDEHPPLWKYWSALPQLVAPKLQLNTDAEEWKRAPTDHNAAWKWTLDSLFRTQGNDGDAFITRARFMMLLLGLGLGAFIAWWAWRIGGPVAAIAATLFFALDPNLLAHASLVTNDVTAAFLFAGLMACTWRLGQEITLRRAMGTALLVGVAVMTKLSLLLAAPVMLLLLAIRAFLPKPWPILGRPDTVLAQRLASLFALGGTIAIVTFGIAWGSYGFRFRPAPDPAVHMDVQSNVRLEKKFLWEREHRGEQATQEQIDQQPLTLFSRTVLAMYEGHILPEPLLDGWLYANAHSLVRRSFFLGTVGRYGQSNYFPIAVMVKTPLATIAAGMLVLALVAVSWRRREGLWTALCLLLPPAIYFFVATRSSLNLGLRHVFPIYPFIFIGIGWAVARVLADRRDWAVFVAGLLAVGLTVESLRIHPYELTFFNTAVGGPRGGLSLLGDSNLDWGQGLKVLARWQEQHPQERLSLAYFGTAEPSAYGVNATKLTQRQQLVLPDFEKESSVLAFTASMLQGVMLDDQSRAMAQRIRWEVKPFEVLGNSVYLYRSSDIATALKQPMTKTQ